MYSVDMCMISGMHMHQVIRKEMQQEKLVAAALGDDSSDVQ